MKKETKAKGDSQVLPEGIDMGALTELTQLYRSGKLNEVIDWYETSTGAGTKEPPPRRPVFKYEKERKNTGIAVSDLILKIAKEKMEGEVSRVGRSLSQLIEFLLWEYVGQPEDLVKTRPDHEK